VGQYKSLTNCHYTRCKTMHFIWASMYLAWRYLLRTLFLRPLLETGPPRYVAIRATQRSSHLQGRSSTFNSFPKYFRPWVMVARTAPKIEPATSGSAVQSSALPTELILLWSLSALFHTHSFIQNCPWTNLVQASLRGTYSCFESHSPTTLVTNIIGKQSL